MAGGREGVPHCYVVADFVDFFFDAKLKKVKKFLKKIEKLQNAENFEEIRLLLDF